MHLFVAYQLRLQNQLWYRLARETKEPFESTKFGCYVWLEEADGAESTSGKILLQGQSWVSVSTLWGKTVPFLCLLFSSYSSQQTSPEM